MAKQKPNKLKPPQGHFGINNNMILGFFFAIITPVIGLNFWNFSLGRVTNKLWQFSLLARNDGLHQLLYTVIGQSPVNVFTNGEPIGGGGVGGIDNVWLPDINFGGQLRSRFLGEEFIKPTFLLR